ncbi:MAG: hypothetical protein IH864_02100 [Chloroflexi bacterium]|nr:hypothetical protein [Chloroflexota bacterium]
MLDADEIAKRLLHRYPKEKLEFALGRFNYRRGELPFPFFDSFRKQSWLSKEQLVWLVDWKTAGRQRRNAELNSDDLVRQATQGAFQEAQRNTSAAVEELSKLKGVAIAVSSAILTAWNPQEFGIIDRWAWDALRNITQDRDVIGQKSGTLFRPEQYARYIKVLRELKKHTGMNCHDLDKALWVLGKRYDR